MYTVVFQSATIVRYPGWDSMFTESMEDIRRHDLGEFASLAEAHDRVLSEAILWDGMVGKINLLPYGWDARTHRNEYDEYMETACYILNEEGRLA